MERLDAIIMGGGLVGLTLAAALDKAGLTAAVIDPADPVTQAAPGFDTRATAIASASWRMFEALGIADALRPHACPINAIRVSDGLEPGAIDFAPDDGEPLGLMIENRTLRAELTRHIQASEVQLLAPVQPVAVERDATQARVTLADGRTLAASLVVACDGRRSPTREAAGIALARWSYDHAAIVGTLDHERPHGNIAYEIFYDTGPFALLPLQPGTRSAFVWSVARQDLPGLSKLGPRAFTHELQTRIGGLFGAIQLAGPRVGYPLGFHHAAKITGERLALAGDSAHGIHPIAGQGLNLGLRDVAALAEVLSNGVRLGLDPGDAQLLARYERWRALDITAIAAATDSLTRLFGIPGRTTSAVRRAGMAAVNATPPLKRFFMNEAKGTGGALPKLLQGEPV